MRKFQEFIDQYGVKRKGRRTTNKESIKFERLINKYINEERDHYKDLILFASSVQGIPPKTAHTYLAAIREFLAYNGFELTSREMKSIRNKMPKGNAARTSIAILKISIFKGLIY